MLHGGAGNDTLNGGPSPTAATTDFLYGDAGTKDVCADGPGLEDFKDASCEITVFAAASERTELVAVTVATVEDRRFRALASVDAMPGQFVQPGPRPADVNARVQLDAWIRVAPGRRIQKFALRDAGCSVIHDRRHAH